MKAIVVEDFKKTPRWMDFKDPIAGTDELVVEVAASALSNLVKAQSNGTHYSSVASFPFVPGADGVGKLSDGSRVFFLAPKRPFGAMGERSLVHKDFCVPVPDDVSDETAASIANPAMSSWAALSHRAQFVAGESVLINGATGTSGRLAVKIARHLGAKKIIVTGRDPKSLDYLRSIGVDEVIPLTQDAPVLKEQFRASINRNHVSVVLDYLWGSSAEAIIDAIGGKGSHHSNHPIRFVQIGSISGHTINMPASALRSTGLQLMGSGLGSVSDKDLVQVIGEALKVATRADLKVDYVTRPMTEAENVWNQDFGNDRLVFTRP